MIERDELESDEEVLLDPSGHTLTAGNINNLNKRESVHNRISTVITHGDDNYRESEEEESEESSSDDHRMHAPNRVIDIDELDSGGIQGMDDDDMDGANQYREDSEENSGLGL